MNTLITESQNSGGSVLTFDALDEAFENLDVGMRNTLMISQEMYERLKRLFDSLPKTTLRLGKKKYTVYKEMGHRFKVERVHATNKRQPRVYKRTRHPTRSHLLA